MRRLQTAEAVPATPRGADLREGERDKLISTSDKLELEGFIARLRVDYVNVKPRELLRDATLPDPFDLRCFPNRVGVDANAVLR